MNTQSYVPDADLIKYWRWHWVVWLILCCLPLLILTLLIPYPGNLILGLCCAAMVALFVFLKIYISMYFDTLNYSIEDDLIVGKRGVYFKKHITVPFPKITNIDISQGPVQRMFGLGTVHVQTAGAAGAQGAIAELRIEGMKNFNEVKDDILRMLRAHSAGTSAAPAAAAADTGEDRMQAMLNELRAIREVLERRA